MKYAIIMSVRNRKYLIGFTNNTVSEKTAEYEKYTVELKENNSIFLPLEGDAAVYLS